MAGANDNGNRKRIYPPAQVVHIAGTIQDFLDLKAPGICCCMLGAPLLSTLQKYRLVSLTCERCGATWIINDKDAINNRITEQHETPHDGRASS